MIRSSLLKIGINLVERGLVPDSITRSAMRSLSRKRLEVDAGHESLEAFMEKSRNGPIAMVPEKANEQHYEVPSDFFGEILGPHRKYSSCYWPEGVSSLEAAERESLEVTCERAGISDGMGVLELGCGWGSFTLFALQKFPGVHVTAVSNSSSQREYILARANELGCSDRLTVVTADVNDFAPAFQFDRVVSIEMFEHIRNHERLLERISRWLVNDGKLFVHVFCNRDRSYEFEDDGPADWMSRYFFSGGIMPSRELLTRYDKDLQVVKTWDWNGKHYQKTLETWLQQMDAKRDRVMEILADTYDDPKIWFQRWRMFIMASAELFGYDNGEEWFVTHYLFENTK